MGLPIIKNKVSILDRLNLVGSQAERDFFIENLSMLLSSGLNISTALNSIKSGIKNRTLIKQIVQMGGSDRARLLRFVPPSVATQLRKRLLGNRKPRN